jgi:hypothetical protein
MFVNSKQRGPEQRRSARRKLGVPIKIDCGDDAPARACILSDVSATGARLVTMAADDLPEQFELLLAGDRGPRRKAAVVWRSKNQVGVRFLIPSSP